MRVYFGGDSLSGMPGMWLGILRKKDGLAKVKADYVESSRLTYEEPVDWPARVKQQMSAGRWDVGVFMIGANDSGMPMIAGGKSVMYPKKAWLEEYESRAKQIATIMLRAGVKRVYWVGMPIMPSSSESKKMRDLNELFENVAASSPDIEYVDSYDLLSTKSGKIDSPCAAATASTTRTRARRPSPRPSGRRSGRTGAAGRVALRRGRSSSRVTAVSQTGLGSPAQVPRAEGVAAQ